MKKIQEGAAEKEVRKQVGDLLDMMDLAAVSRYTGYPKSTLHFWRRNPTVIKAVDLLKLRALLGRGA